MPLNQQARRIADSREYHLEYIPDDYNDDDIAAWQEITELRSVDLGMDDLAVHVGATLRLPADIPLSELPLIWTAVSAELEERWWKVYHEALHGIEAVESPSSQLTI